MCVTAHTGMLGFTLTRLNKPPLLPRYEAKGAAVLKQGSAPFNFYPRSSQILLNLLTGIRNEKDPGSLKTRDPFISRDGALN